MSSQNPQTSGAGPEVQYQSFATGCLPWIIAIVVCTVVVIGCAVWAHSAGLS
jgi:hypothetical protein